MNPAAPVVIVAFHKAMLAHEQEQSHTGVKRRLRRGWCRCHPADLMDLERFFAEQPVVQPPVDIASPIRRFHYAGLEWFCRADITAAQNQPDITLIAYSK